MAGKDPKGRLLEAAIAHVASRGVSDLSLRELAAAIGTSHRMLIHHFGGRQGLWVEVIRAVEERQRAAFAEVVPAPGSTGGDVMRQWWRHISAPALWPNERLFFELYGQALQGRPGSVELLDGIVDAWLEPAATMLAQLGFPDGEATARLGIAVTRGLLLDLLATRDREAVDAAMETYIGLIELRTSCTPSSRPSPRP